MHSPRKSKLGRKNRAWEHRTEIAAASGEGWRILVARSNFFNWEDGEDYQYKWYRFRIRKPRRASTRYAVRKESSQSSAKCAKECVLVDIRHVSDGDTGRLFVKSVFASKRFCYTLRVYATFRNKIKVSETAECVLRDQRVYADHKSGADRKMMNSFVLLIDGRKDVKEIWKGNGTVTVSLSCGGGYRKQKNCVCTMYEVRVETCYCERCVTYACNGQLKKVKKMKLTWKSRRKRAIVPMQWNGLGYFFFYAFYALRMLFGQILLFICSLGDGVAMLSVFYDQVLPRVCNEKEKNVWSGRCLLKRGKTCESRTTGNFAR